MALEDAALLGSLLSRLSKPSQLAPLLHAYERLRHARTARTQASARFNQRVFHLPDGPDQRARDEQMRRAMEEQFVHMRVEWAEKYGKEDSVHANGGSRNGTRCGNGVSGGNESARWVDVMKVKDAPNGAGNANQWADRTKNIEQFSYDADEAAERWWIEEGEVMMMKISQEGGAMA